jgi:hypothetical protein
MREYTYKYPLQFHYTDHKSFSVNIAILSDTAPRSPYVNQRFIGTYHLHLPGKKSGEQEARVWQVPKLVSCLADIYPEDGGDTFL